MINNVIRVAVTGAAGQVAYSLLPRIASGKMLGRDQPVILNLLDITSALPACRGVAMELEDCACPLLLDISISDDPKVAFRDVDIAVLVGARPRTKGMERKDLLEANGALFAAQGKVLSEVAKRGVKILVVGNPANTNCLIAMKNAPELKPENFTSLMRLDHNRAMARVAKKTDRPVSSITRMTVWGNHSATQYPDLTYTKVHGLSAPLLINDKKWIEDTFIPDVQKRGTAILEARGLSSAASAASAVVDHIQDWLLDTPAGDWVSMGLPADGSYGIGEGVIYGYPATCKNGTYQIVKELDISEFGRNRMRATLKELHEERDSVKHLLG